jgi:hypothetical protein
MRKKISDGVVTGEAWASAVEKIIQYFPHIAWLVTMTSVGTWFATGVTTLNQHGWGIYPLVGVLFALVIAVAFCLFGIGMDFFSRWKNRGQGSEPAAAVPDVTSETPVDLFSDAKLELIQNKLFERERVVLDGKCLINPKFRDVTLVYNGGPMHISNMQIRGTVALTSERRDLQNFAKVLDDLKAIAQKMGLKAEVKQGGKTISPQPAAAPDTPPRPSTEEKTPQ